LPHKKKLKKNFLRNRKKIFGSSERRGGIKIGAVILIFFSEKIFFFNLQKVASYEKKEKILSLFGFALTNDPLFFS